MYDARTSKYIGGDDEISFGICLSDVVRDVAAHDGMGNLAESVTRWLHAFVAAWPAAFIIVVVLAPTVQRLTQKIIQKW